MAIKLEDTVAVVQKRFASGARNMSPLQMKTGKTTQLWPRGKTTAGYYCQLMVNPQEVAKIFVDYDYVLYRVLGEDAPDAMWEDLGRKFGLEHVCSVDL